MSKYTFVCEYTDWQGKPDGKVIHENQHDTLTSVIESFERFLRGAGFYFDGHLDIVEEETYTTDTTGVEEEHEWTQTLRSDNEWPFATATRQPDLFDSMDVMPMPGTLGGADIIFNSEDKKCNRRGCGLTKSQLGTHTCYDEHCGLK
jgi:hypothetical protein